MGTYFALQARCEGDATLPLEAAASALTSVDRQMSTYRPDSALMRLNGAPIGTPIEVGPEVVEVLRLATEIRSASDGALDVAIGRLVSAWGFGAEAQAEPPDAATLAALKPRGSGYELLEPDRAERVEDVQMNLSAIAKGYGVDRAAAELQRLCTDFMVDVGGEVRALGLSPSGRPWRVGIEQPSEVRAGLSAVLQISAQAVATSGDYRNYREVDGQRVSHTIDPRTGEPIRHRLASVTVVSKSCAEADGWSTALNVLGPEAGFTLAESLELPAYFVVRAEGGFETRYTSHLSSYLVSP